MRYHKKLDMARTAMFLHEGFMTFGDRSTYTDNLNRLTSGRGHVEGMLRLAEYAGQVFKSMNRLYKALLGSFPGVYEYEVTGDLGAWVAQRVYERGCDPSDAEFGAELRRLEMEFCKRGDRAWPESL